MSELQKRRCEGNLWTSGMYPWGFRPPVLMKKRTQRPVGLVLPVLRYGSM